MTVWYATIEQVKDSMEIAHTVRFNRLVRSKLSAATGAVEGLLHRRFYPERKTVAFDWPNYQYAPSEQLWLENNEMISVESVVAGGTTLTVGTYFLRRSDNMAEPPYDQLQIDASSVSAFGGGTSYQKNTLVTGLYSGDKDTDITVAGALLNGAINSSVQTLVLSPSNGAFSSMLGIGSILLIGTERLIVTDRRMSDTGQNLQSNMSDVQNDTIVDVTDGTLFAPGEVITLGAERMFIVDVVGNNLIVDRAFDGTVLTTHTAPVDVYAARTFTVQRGALGSTAASHSDGDSVYVHEFPGLVNELAIAETVVMLEQSSAGYARVVGSGANARESAGQGLADLRALACQTYGRKGRIGAI